MSNSRKRCVKILQNFMANGNSDGWGISEVLDYISTPITLAEFLGWEENVEYRRGGTTFKVDGNHLLDLRSNGHWGNTCCDTWELIDLRNAVKVKPKKYYLKHKFIGRHSRGHLNHEQPDGVFYLSGTYESSTFQTQFTEEEIKKIEEIGLDLTNFERIEVEVEDD